MTNAVFFALIVMSFLFTVKLTGISALVILLSMYVIFALYLPASKLAITSVAIPSFTSASYSTPLTLTQLFHCSMRI